MWRLIKHFSKENQFFFALYLLLVLIVYLLMFFQEYIYQTTFIHFSEAMELMIVLMVFGLGCNELRRIVRTYREKQLRLLPISVPQLYFSNLLFSWGVSGLLVVGCSLLFHGSFYNVVQMDWWEYWNIAGLGLYILLVSLVQLQFLYLVSRVAVSYCKPKYRNGLLPIVFLLLLALMSVISDSSETLINRLPFSANYPLLTLQYLTLGDIFFIILFFIFYVWSSIYLIQHYIEPERR